MRHSFRLLLVTALLAGGCELVGPDTIAPRSVVGLNPGTTFTYRATFFQTDENGQPVIVGTDSFLVEVLREEKAIGSYRDLIHLRAFSVNPDADTTDIWYQETTDELVEVAYRNVGATAAVTPKRGAAVVGDPTPFFQPRTLSMLAASGRLPLLPTAADSIIVRAEPRVVFALPLADGARWVTIRNPFIQAREVVGTDTVQVAAGTFTCRVIVTRVPILLPGLLWVDCVAPEGLIQRDILTESIGADGKLRRTIEHMELVAVES